MKEFWKQHKIPTTIAIYAFTAVLFFVLIINPLIADIRANSDEIQKNRIDSEIRQERINKLPEMREGHEIYEQEKNNLNVILDQENSVDFIKKIEYLAEETGNKVSLSIEDRTDESKNSKASKEKKDPEDIKGGLPSDKYLSMKLVLEGNYENFIRFIYKLENLDYYVNVISVDLSKKTLEEQRKKTEAGGDNKPVERDILISTLEIAAYTK